MKTVNHNFTLRIFILFIFGSILFSCGTKGTINPINNRTISAEFKSYVAFDSTSYWVYRKENATVANIDTVRISRVIKDRRFYTDQTPNPGYYYDAIEMIYSSKLLFSKSEISAGAPLGNATMTENYRLYFKDGRYFSIFIPKFPFGQIQRLGINEGNYTNVEKKSEFWVGGTKYNDVYFTTVKDYKNGPDTVYMEFYIAKNYGLIKYVKYHPSQSINDIWNLTASVLRQSK